MDRAALASHLNDVNSALTEAYRTYAFDWENERRVKVKAIDDAWTEGYNGTKTADFVTFVTVDETVNSVKTSQEIKALEQDYAHTKFRLEQGLCG